MAAVEAPTSELMARACASVLPDTITYVERMNSGMSTWVYRIACADRELYARVLPEDNAGFAPEALAHVALRAAGVHVPDVIYWDEHHPLLDRSMIITTAVAGQPLDIDTDAHVARDVLHAAGSELALANKIPVDGWGWATRTAGIRHIAAEFPTAREWMESERALHLSALHRHAIFAPPVLAAINRAFERYTPLFAHDTPCLAHGDYDLSHIFVANGAYSGVIDWGEIRGAPPFYDLGHFYLHHPALLPLLSRGFEEITALPFDIDQIVGLISLHIAIERVGGGLIRRPHQAPFATYVEGIERALALLA